MSAKHLIDVQVQAFPEVGPFPLIQDPPRPEKDKLAWVNSSAEILAKAATRTTWKMSTYNI